MLTTLSARAEAFMCAVPTAPGADGVRVWSCYVKLTGAKEVATPPDAVHVAYPLLSEHEKRMF